MRWLAILASLVLPGLGHTMLGLPFRGLAFSLVFVACALSLVCFGFGLDDPMSDARFGTALWGTCAVYAACQLSLWQILIRAARSANLPAKDDALRAGMAAAARDADTEAEREFRRVLALDPTDVEAHLNLGALHARNGRVRKARRHLLRGRRFDLRGKWDWEVERELAVLADGSGGNEA